MWTGFLYGSALKIADVYLLNAGLVSLVGLLMWFAMSGGKPADGEKAFRTL